MAAKETGVEFQRKHGGNLTGLIAGFIDRGPAASIEELLANSYDADGTEIRVDFGEDRLVVADNGIGMKKGAGLEGFYRLGASEKLDERDSPNGRKRIGKFGVATILLSTLCHQYELRTWRDNIETAVSETFEEEITARKKIDGVEKPRRKKDSGTIITMQGLKFDPNEDFLTELERRFQWELPILPDFQVYLNGDLVQSKVFTKGTRFDCSGEGPELGSVTGDLYYTASTSPSAGLHIYVNGRRVGDPKALLSKYGHQKGSIIGHVTGIVHADGLEPAIDFDRSRFKEYYGIYEEFEKILRDGMNEVRKHIDVSSAAKRSVAVSKQGGSLTTQVRDRLADVKVQGVNGETKISLDETGEDSLGSYDGTGNRLVINKEHPQLVIAGGMNAAQYERAILDAAVSILAKDRAGFRDGTLESYLEEQRNLWAQINGMGDATNMEVTPGRYYSPAELARFGVFGSNTIRDLVTVGIIKEAAMDGERIKGARYQEAVKKLDGMVSLTDLCRRQLGRSDPVTVARCTNVLNYAADQSRPFTYCIVEPDGEEEVHLVDSIIGSRVYAIGTKIPLDRGPESGDSNRESVRGMFHKLADSYATLAELDENLDGVGTEQIQSAIEYASESGISMRSKNEAYRIGDVVTAFQSKRGNLAFLQNF